VTAQAEESLKRLYGAEYCSQQETLLIREEQHRKEEKFEFAFLLFSFFTNTWNNYCFYPVLQATIL
jgi:hypothetical protein